MADELLTGPERRCLAIAFALFDKHSAVDAEDNPLNPELFDAVVEAMVAQWHRGYAAGRGDD